jgi:hypothetical protein
MLYMLCQHFCFGQILYGMFWAWERSGFALSFSGLNNRAVSQCYVLKVYLFLNNETELWLYMNGFRIFISGLCYCLYNLKQQSYSSCWAQWKPIWPISVSAEPHHLTLKSTPRCAIPASPGRTGGVLWRRRAHRKYDSNQAYLSRDQNRGFPNSSASKPTRTNRTLVGVEFIGFSPIKSLEPLPRYPHYNLARLEHRRRLRVFWGKLCSALLGLGLLLPIPCHVFLFSGIANLPFVLLSSDLDCSFSSVYIEVKAICL